MTMTNFVYLAPEDVERKAFPLVEVGRLVAISLSLTMCPRIICFGKTYLVDPPNLEIHGP